MSGLSARRWLGSLAVLIATVAVMTGSTFRPPATDGPLSFRSGAGGSEPIPAGVAAGTSMSLAVGQTHTSGIGELYNTSSSPVTIEDVRAVYGVPGITILGALIYPPSPDRYSADVSNWDRFPPNDNDMGTPIPAAGFIVPPHTTGIGYAIVVGIAGTGIGRATIRHFVVDYEADGLQYAVSYPSSVAVCAPPATGDTCPPEYNVS